MKRRTFISAATAGTAVLAGCSSSNGDEHENSRSENSDDDTDLNVADSDGDSDGESSDTDSEDVGSDSGPEDVLNQMLAHLNEANVSLANDLLHEESPRSFGPEALPVDAYVVEDIEPVEAELEGKRLRLVLSDAGETATFEYTLRQEGAQWTIFDWELRSEWQDESSSEDGSEPDTDPEEVLQQLVAHLNDGDTTLANDLLHPDSSRSFGAGALPIDVYLIDEIASIESGTARAIVRIVLSDDGESATFEYTLQQDDGGQWGILDWDLRRGWSEDERDSHADPEDVLGQMIDHLNGENISLANDLLHIESPRSFTQDSLPQDVYVIEEIEPVESGSERVVVRMGLSDAGESATFEYTLEQSETGRWDIFDWNLRSGWGQEADGTEERISYEGPETVLRQMVTSLNDGNLRLANDLLHVDSSRSFTQASLPLDAYAIDEMESIESGSERVVVRLVLSDAGESATFEYTLRQAGSARWAVFDWEVVQHWK
ncbi:hypothetical protein ACLI4R_09300 [Natrialbaceae archaeon A-chndr2]